MIKTESEISTGRARSPEGKPEVLPTHENPTHEDEDRRAFDRLIPLVYEDLRRIARQQLNRPHAGQTLDTSSLVNELYIKLVIGKQVTWENRSHFLAIAARAMRQILIDYARERSC